MGNDAKAKEDKPKEDNSEVIFAFSFLTFVAVTKTLLTKYVFTHVDTPVAFSVLSCVATMAVILPIFIVKPSYFGWVRRDMMFGFVASASAIAIDLGCTNVAISELSVAMQQTIKATSPAATVLLEVAFARKCQHPVVFMLIGLLCIGSVLVKWGSSDYDATAYGMVMMIVAVVSGAFKYVMAHQMIRAFREDLGVLAFTFWVELFVTIMLTPVRKQASPRLEGPKNARCCPCPLPTPLPLPPPLPPPPPPTPTPPPPPPPPPTGLWPTEGRCPNRPHRRRQPHWRRPHWRRPRRPRRRRCHSRWCSCS